ncbi:hypothetical protein H5410_012682 [Solanum commersonii]|uniref:Uncharacterized protein n=1 Tax=Solanum commersonii TaxID=4109 RepID=A0A9J6AS97_SOLCO|nr:hypothetical protein H5410_012682 [Solanum commersonii]
MKVLRAYSMILSDESQRSVVANAGVLGTGPTNLQSSFDAVIVKSSTCTNSSDARDGHMRGDEEFRTQSQLDSCALTREQYGQILQLLEKKSEVPHCVNAADSSDNNLTPHFYQNTPVDMVSQEQEENCEVEVHEERQIEPVPQTRVRKSGRGTKPPLWMKDFVSLNIHEGPYSLDKNQEKNSKTQDQYFYFFAGGNLKAFRSISADSPHIIFDNKAKSSSLGESNFQSNGLRSRAFEMSQIRLSMAKAFESGKRRRALSFFLHFGVEKRSKPN